MAVHKRGFDEFIADLHSLPERANKAFPRVLAKGARNIKTDWRARWEAIRRPRTHIPHLVGGIGYDTQSEPPVWAAQVGVSSLNSQAALAHLIEYGSIHNAPVPAGQESLDEEIPRFEKAVGDVALELLDGR